MQMDRNTSTEGKDRELLSNLKGLFGKKLNLARIKFVTLFILALCKTRKDKTRWEKSYKCIQIRIRLPIWVPF